MWVLIHAVQVCLNDFILGSPLKNLHIGTHCAESVVTGCKVQKGEELLGAYMQDSQMRSVGAVRVTGEPASLQVNSRTTAHLLLHWQVLQPQLLSLGWTEPTPLSTDLAA